MNMQDDHQRLALLPPGIEEENIKSWEHVRQFCEWSLSQSQDSRWQSLLDLVQRFSNSGQCKFYRAGLSLSALIISTRDKHVLEKGDACIYVLINDDETAEIRYSAVNTELNEMFDCRGHEIFTRLQPLLDKLWNETRGRANAPGKDVDS